eukprot:1084574-Pelagomonas_calceolata.AAC.1
MDMPFNFTPASQSVAGLPQEACGCAELGNECGTACLNHPLPSQLPWPAPSCMEHEHAEVVE